MRPRHKIMPDTITGKCPHQRARDAGDCSH
jgi:hypothetical protein